MTRSTDPHSDPQLVALLKRGDTGAFNELYWKYHKAVYCNSLKLTKDASAAEDIVQEVFIRLWQKRESIDANKSISGWLFIISYGKSVNWFKRKLLEIRVQKELLLSNPEEEISAVYNLQIEVLEKAMNQLSPQKRRVFELCKLHGKSYEEAAAELNISRHTVKEYISLALSAIKEYVNAHPEYKTSLSVLTMVSYIAATR